MPLYEYLCASCGNTFEFLAIGAGERPDCPQCGSRQLKKLLSASSPASGVKEAGPPPGHGGGTCCGQRPSEVGCTPGGCCGKAVK